MSPPIGVVRREHLEKPAELGSLRCVEGREHLVLDRREKRRQGALRGGSRRGRDDPARAPVAWVGPPFDEPRCLELVDEVDHHCPVDPEPPADRLLVSVVRAARHGEHGIAALASRETDRRRRRGRPVGAKQDGDEPPEIAGEVAGHLGVLFATVGAHESHESSVRRTLGRGRDISVV